MSEPAQGLFFFIVTLISVAALGLALHAGEKRMSEHPGSYPPPPAGDDSNMENLEPHSLENFHPVSSSNIQAIAWVCPADRDLYELHHHRASDAQNEGRLRVIFHNGDVWEYADVHYQAALQLLEADSVGSFFNENIRNNFEGRQLDLHSPTTKEPS